MGCAEFIKKHFVGQELCISVNDGEGETFVFDQHWIQNREYFKGIVEEVSYGVVVLDVYDKGNVYISEEHISFFWTEPFNPYKFMRTAFSKKLPKILS